MFDFFKKKNKKEDAKLVEEKFTLISPATGKTIPLSEVPDPVFAQKMTGDGVAVIPSENIIVAPADGELSLVFDTKHAFALTLDNGAELLVHIGIDTVSLKGEGFKQLVEQGTKVTAGTPIIEIDRDLITSKGFALTTPVLITNPDSFKELKGIENVDTVAGETVVVEYSK